MGIVLGGKKAITHIKVLKRYYNSNVTLILATLETGRTHQIRVHMKYLGHSLVGDLTYGNKCKSVNADRQLLHAKKLGFIHPSTKKYIEFEANLPKDFEEILGKLEKKEE